jgi:hypothetical protein
LLRIVYIAQELEALKKRVKEMEEEDEKLRKMQDELESSQEVGGKAKLEYATN